MNLNNFYCIGDIGTYSQNLLNIINIIKNKNKENGLFVILGDNFYPNGINYKNGSEWNKFLEYFKTNIPIYSILGNHDYILNPYAQINSNYWNMPNFFYFRQFNNIGCWFLDTQILDPGDINDNSYYLNLHSRINEIHNNKYKVFNTQIEWLNKSFETHKNLKYKLVFGHYPIISGGLYNKNEVLYELLIDVFSFYNINAYISGHDHNLQHLQIKINNKYKFNQFISGCTNINHSYKINTNKKYNLFFNSNPGFLKIIKKNDNLEFKFISENNNKLYIYNNFQ